MLGPTGPAEARRVSDPDLVSFYEIPRSIGFNVLRLFGGVVLVAASLWVVMLPDVGIVPKLVMGLCGAFFVYALATQGAHILCHRPPTFDAEGLHFDYLGNRRCLPWDNIRDAKTWRYMSTRISVLSLNDVGAFVTQFSPRDLRAAIRNENVGNFFIIVLGFLTPSGSSPDGRDARAELARLLTLKRERYGGEICLATADLDRGADEFNALILAWKVRYGH